MPFKINPTTGSLDYYETATAETAASILAKLITVDGAGSGLDADLLDGNSSAAFEPADATIVKTGNASWIDLTDGGLTTLHKHQDLNTVIAPAANILTLTNAAASTLALNITAAKTLTLTAADNYTLTVPATGTAALLATANVFTAQQQITVATATSNALILKTSDDSIAKRILEVRSSIDAVLVGINKDGWLGGGDYVVFNPTLQVQYRVGGSQTVTYTTSGISYAGAGQTQTFATGPVFTVTTPNNGAAQQAIRYQIGTFPATTTTRFLSLCASGGGSERFIVYTGGGIVSTNYADNIGLVLKANATQTAAMVEHRDSSDVVHNHFTVAHATNVYENVLNEQGSPNLDFRVETDSYDGIFVDASNNSIMVMSNAAGKVGFYGTTAIVQPAGATQAAPAAYATGGFGLDSDAHMQALYDLVVAIRTALVNTGIMKGAA